jgi:hypothetical protein
MGCQENSVTDPLSTESSNKVQNSDTYTHDIIVLRQLLNDPYPIGNSHYMISGQIEYEHRLVSANLMKPAPKQYVSLSLSIDADLKYFSTVSIHSAEDELAGFITEESEEYLSVAGNSVTQLETSFVIQGREDGMVLKCRFFVTTGGMELSAMWLALPDENAVATH